MSQTKRRILNSIKEIDKANWGLNYSPIEWYDKNPENAFYYTSVDIRTCPDISELKPGDEIEIMLNDKNKVISVRKTENIVETPTVYCPKEKREVPIWWCLGSYTQKRDTCPELITAKVNLRENHAEVKCKAQEEAEE